MTTLTSSLSATAAPRPQRLRARPMRVSRIAAATVVATVLGSLAWALAAAGVIADDDGIRLASRAAARRGLTVGPG